MSRRLVLPLVLAALAAGCAQRALRPLKVSGDVVRASPACAGSCRDTVDLLYLGVGGFVIRRGERALMTAPSVSHRGVLPVFFRRPIVSDDSLVDALMQEVQRRLPRHEVSGILVGHGHYDHLLDVPRTAVRWTPNALVYGSATVKNLLAPFPGLDTARVRAVDDSAGDAHQNGRWIYTRDRAFRFMPLRSKHAPNFLGWTIAKRSLDTALTVPPTTAHDWLMGRVYAYLIEVLDAREQPVFRLLYQDAAAARAYESLPVGLGPGTVDVAIVTVGNFKGRLFGVRDYPHALLDSLKPRRVVLGHWENFFRAPSEPLRVVPLTDTREMVRRVERSVGPENWVTLQPLARERYVF